MLFEEVSDVFFFYLTESSTPTESQRVSAALFLGEKHIFLAELSFLCGGPGLAFYSAGNQPEDCMAVGPLRSVFQAADHRHSHFTMVTCFIPSEFLAPAVQDS